jgi:hypothetical protein
LRSGIFLFRPFCFIPFSIGDGFPSSLAAVAAACLSLFTERDLRLAVSLTACAFSAADGAYAFDFFRLAGIIPE